MMNKWGGIESSNKQFYSPSHKVIFYHITKCAMTSIIKELQCIQTSHQKTKEDKTIAVIRDPITRFVSGFFQLRRKGYQPGYSAREVKTKNFWKTIQEKPVKTAFPIYFKEVCSNTPFDSHNMSQTAFLDNDPIQPMVGFSLRSLKYIDVFLRFEHLSEDMKTHLNVTLKNFKNQTMHPEKSWCENFLKEEKNLTKLKQIWGKDFILYESINP